MKKALLLLSIVFLSACKKENSESATFFSMPYTQTITIPAVPRYPYGTSIPGGSVAIPAIPLTISINPQQVDEYIHISSPALVSAMFTNMNMNIITPGTGNFNFLNDIQLSILTGAQPEEPSSPNNILIAFANNIPLNQKGLNLIIEPAVNLEDYAVNGNVVVQLNAYINTIPPPGTQIIISGNINIVVNSL